jgi:hypothetical protein
MPELATTTIDQKLSATTPVTLSELWRTMKSGPTTPQ